jgi:hypothetical protein
VDAFFKRSRDRTGRVPFAAFLRSTRPAWRAVRDGENIPSDARYPEPETDARLLAGMGDARAP